MSMRISTVHAVWMCHTPVEQQHTSSQWYTYLFCAERIPASWLKTVTLWFKVTLASVMKRAVDGLQTATQPSISTSYSS